MVRDAAFVHDERSTGRAGRRVDPGARLASFGRHARRAGAILIACAAPVAAQAPPPVVLKTPLAEHDEPLSQATSLLELADGRVLVADTKDRLLLLYDFAKGTATPVSRQGAGPLEYQFPSGIFAAGDSILVIDLMQQRALVLDRSAKPLRSHRLVSTGDAITTLVRLGTIVAVDGRGAFYSETRGMTMVPGQMPTMSDTVALVRWKSLGTSGDTIATRVDPAPMPKMSGNPTDGMSVKLPIMALQPRDAWAIFTSGVVAIARAADYHSEWVDVAGARRVGPRVTYAPIVVTEADKARVRRTAREEAERGLKLGTSMAAGSGQKMPRITLDLEEPGSWPRVKPPFTAVRAAPDGRLWVARSQAGSRDVTEYDVLAPGGKLERRVQFPPRVTLLGFGKGMVVYGVRKDEDDLHYLQRYRLP
jgi:hypothetical protein